MKLLCAAGSLRQESPSATSELITADARSFAPTRFIALAGSDRSTSPFVTATVLVP